MDKFRKGSKISAHSKISDYSWEINQCNGSRKAGINKKCSRFSVDDALLVKISKQQSRLQEEDINAYDYGRLSQTFSTLFKPE